MNRLLTDLPVPSDPDLEWADALTIEPLSGDVVIAREDGGDLESMGVVPQSSKRKGNGKERAAVTEVGGTESALAREEGGNVVVLGEKDQELDQAFAHFWPHVDL